MDEKEKKRQEAQEIYEGYLELMEHGDKSKSAIYRELGELYGRSPSAISAIVWRTENPDREKANRVKKKEKGPKEPAPAPEESPEESPFRKVLGFEPREYENDLKDFINHYREVVQELYLTKKEFFKVKNELTNLKNTLSHLIKGESRFVVLDKDRDTNNYFVQVELDDCGKGITSVEDDDDEGGESIE